jgi:hypothetical protein
MQAEPWSLRICGVSRALGVEFDFTRQFDNGLGVAPVFKEGEFEGLGAINEEATIKSMLLLGDPVAAAVLADKGDGRCRVTRGRFGEFHVGHPCCW